MRHGIVKGGCSMGKPGQRVGALLCHLLVRNSPIEMPLQETHTHSPVPQLTSEL